MALRTEAALQSTARSLAEADPATGKSLLVRASTPALAPTALHLLPCDSDDRWAQYEELRVEVEAGFGLSEDDARRLVRATRERGQSLGLRLWLAEVPNPSPVAVGGVAAFCLPPPDETVFRLQEIDIFPAHRGRGLGRPLLEAVRRQLHQDGAQRLVVGADEDDWPLAWYRRLGFRPVARVARRR